jgi:hypothetical protein
MKPSLAISGLGVLRLLVLIEGLLGSMFHELPGRAVRSSGDTRAYPARSADTPS